MTARHFPRLDGLLLGNEDEDDQDKVAALDIPGEDIPGLKPGDTGRVRQRVRARVDSEPPPFLRKVVGGIWRADPSQVVAVDISIIIIIIMGVVEPSTEVEILQRHQVVAANLIFRGHLVKLYRGKWGRYRGGEGGRGAVIRWRASQLPRWR